MSKQDLTFWGLINCMTMHNSEPGIIQNMATTVFIVCIIWYVIKDYHE